MLIIAGIVLIFAVLGFAASVGFKLKTGFISFDLTDRPTLAKGTWAFLGIAMIAGLGLLAVGTWDFVQDSENERDIARKAAEAGLAESRGRISETIAQLPLPSPTSGPEPTSEPQPSPLDLFDEAFAADEAGRNDEAIALYSEAIDAGLEGERKRLAHLEIVLLEILEASLLDPVDDEDLLIARCANARSNFFEGGLSQTELADLAHAFVVCPGGSISLPE